jgi:hypothetical protein
VDFHAIVFFLVSPPFDSSRDFRLDLIRLFEVLLVLLRRLPLLLIVVFVLYGAFRKSSGKKQGHHCFF